jgi:hypothetical protein
MSEEVTFTQEDMDFLYLNQLLAVQKTRESLKAWLLVFLDVDLSDSRIDENSTSTAFEMVWSVYESMITGDPAKTHHVVAVARGGAKTLSAVIIEILAMLHFGRDVVHCAAEEHQSVTALGWFDKLIIDNKHIQGFIDKSNKRSRRFTNLPKSEYRSRSYCELNVVIATLSGVNGKRGHLIVCDELDLVDPTVLSELAYIQVPLDGRTCISLFLSSRQSSSGPIQKKIDMAADPRNDITLHTWSVVDLMKKCSPEVYKSDSEKQEMHINNYTLGLMESTDFKALTPTLQSEYSSVHLHEGCMRCPIVSVCRGRAIQQTSENKYLRSIADVKNLIIQSGSPASIIARVLNLKPESNGLVFSFFERRKHFRPIDEVWEFAFGEKPSHYVTKLMLCNKLRELDWHIINGVDFGYSPDPATSVLIGYQSSSGKLIVINVENATMYDNESWLQYVKESVYDVYGFDTIAPDLAYVVALKKARILGMPAREFSKPKVEPGVSFIRQKLYSPISQQTRFMLVADQKNEFMAQEFESWSYMKTNSGYLHGQFQKDGPNHSLDALRYAINSFIVKDSSRPVYGTKQALDVNNPQYIQQKQVKETTNQIADFYKQNFGVDLTSPADKELKKKKRGGFTALF